MLAVRNSKFSGSIVVNSCCLCLLLTVNSLAIGYEPMSDVCMCMCKLKLKLMFLSKNTY